MRYRPFLISVILLSLLVGGLAACVSSGATPSAIPVLTSPAAPSIPAVLPTQTISFTPQAVIPITAQNASGMEAVRAINQAGAIDFGWCEGGRSLCVIFPDEVVIYDMAKEAVSQRISADSPKQLAVSSDQETLAWVEGEHQIHMWNPQKDYDILVDSGAESIIDLIFDPTGVSLVGTTGDYQILSWNINGDESDYSVNYPGWLVDLDYSPDGAQLAGVSQEEFVVPIFDVLTGLEQRRLVWSEHASPVLYGAYFSPNWQTIAWVTRGTIQLMNVGSASLGPTLEHEDFIVATSWSPTNKLIASAAAGTVGGNYLPLVALWDVESGRVVATLVHDAPILQIAFSPDGSQLASLDNNGMLRIWAASGAQPK
jgi:WD40 repeat protein